MVRQMEPLKPRVIKFATQGMFNEYMAQCVRWASQVALVVRNLAPNAGDSGLILRSGRSPERGLGNPFQYSCLKNSHGQSSLAGYIPWGCKEMDATEATQCTHTHAHRECKTSKNFMKDFQKELMLSRDELESGNRAAFHAVRFKLMNLTICYD